MRKVNTLELRQSLSKIMEMFQENGEPILLEKGRKPIGVIISIEDFKMRFSEKDADDQRKLIQEEILMMKRKSKDPRPSEKILRTFREG